MFGRRPATAHAFEFAGNRFKRVDRGGEISYLIDAIARASDKGADAAEEGRGVDFQLTANQQRLQHRCRELAADFARRSAAHDRDASHPIENYERLREEGFSRSPSARNGAARAPAFSITR